MKNANPQPEMSLAKMPEQPLAVAPSPAEMMQAMIKCGVTENNVAAFEKLAELQWKFESRDAETAYSLLPHVLAKKGTAQ